MAPAVSYKRVGKERRRPRPEIIPSANQANRKAEEGEGGGGGEGGRRLGGIVEFG